MTANLSSVDHVRLKMPHEPMDPRCGFHDGYRVSFLTRLVMGLVCNTCRTLAVRPREFVTDGETSE